MKSFPRGKVFILTLMFFGLSYADWVSIGQSHSFVCTSLGVERYASFTWRNSVYKTMFLCDSLEKECVPAFDTLLDLYDVNITSDASKYTSVFTIKYVVLSLHNTTWYCNVDSGSGLRNTSQYNLYVYAPPTSPSCFNVTLHDDVNITVLCFTEKVFPEALCIFYIKTNNTRAVETKNGSLTYQHGPSSSAGYNRTECTYTVSADIIGPGSHVFYVEMFAHITSNVAEEMKRASQYTDSVKIGLPEAALSPDCQVNDYIKENQNRTCTCYDKSQTFLPTQVTWSVGDMQDRRLVFLSQRPSSDNTIYTCTISNQLNWIKQIKYEPKVTYGPDNVILTLFNTSLDQCGNNGAYISGTCTVSDSNPDPTVYIYVSNSPVTSQHKVAKTDYRFSQVISESGIVYVLCRAVNSVFEDISSEKISSITVKGPPEAPQISSMSGKSTKTLTDGNQLQVTEGNTDIVCESRGGFPLYKNLTLVCGTNTQTNEQSDTISMTLKVSRDMQGVNCTCVVWHESKCLHNFVTVTLKLPLDEQNNVGAIIGGVIAPIIGVVLIVALTVFLVKRRSNKLKRQLQEANANKMQTYSNVQASEDYMNSDTHQYERPSITHDDTTHADVHTPRTIRQPKLPENYSDTNVLGGFIEQTNRQQQPKENKKIKADACKEGETDVKPEEHHYEEINDVNTLTYDTSTCKEIAKPELSASYVNLEIVQQASVL
ncbi:unnamed protein product [Lymnaea stagnalis]|uniref:Ig-like domain-containing protein n=1 Tax=Lymnaea stagnalis TaxID=6523 RepID=A0AAV2HGA6_LYMST